MKNKYFKRGLKRFIALGIPFLFILPFLYHPTISLLERTQGRTLIEHPGWFTGLKPLNIEDFKIVSAEGGSVLLEISNPNRNWGASYVFYEVELFNSDTGEVLESFEEETYILPNDRRYIYKGDLSIPGETTEARVSIGFVEWKKVEETSSINVEAEEIRFEVMDDDFDFFANLQGALVNNTEFGISETDIVAMLYESILEEEDELIAVGGFSAMDLVAHEDRDFEILWPYEFAADDVAITEVEVYPNVLKDGSFMDQHGSRGKVHERSFGISGSATFSLP